MPKPKRFKQQNFKAHFEEVIERLILEKQTLLLNHHDVQVEEIANAFDVHPMTLRRWSQEYLNTSPKKYLADYRINKAKTLLQQGIRPIKVSEMLGYPEYKVFSASFKRLVQVPPSTFNFSH